MRPVELGPNQPRQFYRGGAAITKLRGVPSEDGFRPEDWVASTTARFGMSPQGLTRLPDGRYLRDVLEGDPEGWFGPSHVSYFGASPALLVKLLDAGQRLPVHVHPPRPFALRHLGSRHGKTEAWVVLGASGSSPAVYLGWSRDVEQAELARWVADQEVEAMLANLNKLVVRPGDAVLVPAGTAHAIGEGVFSVELQEPTDFSVMLELEGFDMGEADGELGLGRELAISCVRGRAFSGADIDRLRSYRGAPAAGGPLVEDVLPGVANPYFRAQRARGGDGARLEASFAVVVGVSGAGVLDGEGWEAKVKVGSTLVVPWGAGPAQLRGQVELLRCLPPLPSDAATDDPAPHPVAAPAG
ncbi:MAG: class I mannose-6-phosphate isomerase [Acidimicrobiales bacterium]